MSEQMNKDFLGNQINIGDKVIFVAPGYRHLVVGKVISKAPKSCQIRYINDWNYEHHTEVVRQGYMQVIKYLDITECKGCIHSALDPIPKLPEDNENA